MELSVIILSYNHENFIAEALESVLMQKTTFKFTIIVADDGSTDNTPKILSEYKNKYPNKIELISSSENKGVFQNAFSTISKINSKYIALLDGDDFWTFKDKLQTQYDFLKNNSDYSGCFHNTRIIQHEGANKILFNSFHSYAEIYSYKPEIYPWDITSRLIIPSSSIFFEAKFLNDPSLRYINDGFSIVWKITCLAIKYKKFYYFNQAWSSYRNHMQGISKSRTTDFHISHIDFLKNLIKDDYYRNIPFEIQQSIASEYYILLNKLKDNKSKSIPLKLKLNYIKSEIIKVWLFLKKLKS